MKATPEPRAAMVYTISPLQLAGQRWKDQAAAPADLRDTRLNDRGVHVDSDGDVAQITRMPPPLGPFLGHSGLSYSPPRQSQLFACGENQQGEAARW